MAGGEQRSMPPGLEAALAAYPQLVRARREEIRLRPIGTGLLHASFAVTTPDGEFVAQRVNPVFAAAIHANIRAVTRHLAARGRVTVSLCETADGALFVETASGERWRLMERLPGVTFETCSDVEQARSAGRVTGEFHAGLVDFADPLAPMGFPFHDTEAHLRDLRQAVRRHAAHRRAADVARLAERLLDAVEALRPPGDLPLRVVHGDLKFSNVLFAGASGADRARAVALIDLDTLARLPLYFDVGDAWRSWANRRPEDEPDAELDVALFVAAAEGWRARFDPPLGEAERVSIENALENVTLELCARFATDALEERYFAWDPERFESAAEHNWARARGQWSLLEQARATRGERLAALRGAL
jgi:Ser/Thr protein kinase RdoA (MazF antagonist)